MVKQEIVTVLGMMGKVEVVNENALLLDTGTDSLMFVIGGSGLDVYGIETDPSVLAGFNGIASIPVRIKSDVESVEHITQLSNEFDIPISVANGVIDTMEFTLILGTLPFKDYRGNISDVRGHVADHIRKNMSKYVRLLLMRL
ncbi:hypothetical protein ACJ7VZ_05375 [Aeromonas salmonicida]|uniref:hypothetical protein n=1 Tax=Aeromonas salmonicida TaxID=645 RepID=UPI0038BBD730